MIYETKFGPVPANKLPISLRRVMDHITAHGIDKRSTEGKAMAEALERVEATAKALNPHLAPQSGQEEKDNGKSRKAARNRRNKADRSAPR